jgi:hypothetical protein
MLSFSPGVGFDRDGEWPGFSGLKIQLVLIITTRIALRALDAYGHRERSVAFIDDQELSLVCLAGNDHLGGIHGSDREFCHKRDPDICCDPALDFWIPIGLHLIVNLIDAGENLHGHDQGDQTNACFSRFQRKGEVPGYSLPVIRKDDGGAEFMWLRGEVGNTEGQGKRLPGFGFDRDRRCELNLDQAFVLPGK